MDQGGEWLSVSEAAEYTGVSTTALRNWHRRGEVRSVPAGAEELLGKPFVGEQRGRRGLCFRRADLEPLHVLWERGRPDRQRIRAFHELVAQASAAYYRWEAHAMRCRRRQRCPLAYVALWGWHLMPDQGTDERGRVRIDDLREPFDDIEYVAFGAMCGRGKWLYNRYLDASAAVDDARAGRSTG